MINDEIKPSFKDKLYQETLDEFARKQWNPESNKQDFQDWIQLYKSYREHGNSIEGWKIYCNDIEKAIRLAIDKTDAEARADQKEKDGVYMVGRYWSNQAKERIQKAERQRCIEIVKEILNTDNELMENATTSSKLFYQNRINTLDVVLTKLSEKVD